MFVPPLKVCTEFSTSSQVCDEVPLPSLYNPNQAAVIQIISSTLPLNISLPLNIQDSTLLHLTDMFPSLVYETFDDIISLSSAFLKRDAQEEASTAAATQHAIDPSSVLIDRALVMEHSDIAQRHGLSALQSLLFDNLAATTLQPLSACDSATVEYAMPGSVALWTDLVTHGAKLTLQDGFTPSLGRLFYSVPPRDTQLAFERLNLGDQRAGRNTIIPLDLFTQLVADEHIESNALSRSIAFKSGTAKGRLVVAPESINFPEKKAILADRWGDIVYPRIADYCHLILECQSHFAEPVSLFKMDKEAWYRRIRLNPSCETLLVFSVHLDDVPHVVIPTAQQFGVQESNYHSDFAGHVVDSITAEREIRTHGIRVSLLYSDDTVGCLPPRLHLSEVKSNTDDFTRLCGAGVIQDSKTLSGSSLEVIGFLVDCERNLISISLKLLLSVICVLFLEFPLELTTSTIVPIKLLQRLSSYMILISDVVHFLRPFSRAASHNTAGRTHPTASLSNNTVSDIWMWRAVLPSITTSDVSWMTLPLDIPPLLRRSKGDDDATRADRSARQAAHATVVIHVDACMVAMGFIVALLGILSSWASFPLPDFLSNVLFQSISPKADINIREFFAAVVALSLVGPLYAGTPSHPTHIHIFTDNTSALSWMTKYRSSHPLVAYLLQIFSHLQVKHHLVVTSSHIPGEINILADAASRQFRCPNGKRLFETLSPLKRFTVLPPWLLTSAQSATSALEVTWQGVLDTLTALE